MMSADPSSDASHPSSLPLVLAIGGAVVSAVFFWYLPLVAVGATVGVVALVLVLRARRRGERGGLLTGAGVLGAAVAVAGIVLAVAPVLPGLPSTNQVEIRAEGTSGFTVAFQDDIESHAVHWPPGSDWRAGYATERTSVLVTVAAPEGAPDASVSCQILWNEAVVSEVSGSGVAICHYDAR